MAVILTDVLVVRAGIARGHRGGGTADILFPTVAHTAMLAVATVLSIVEARTSNRLRGPPPRHPLTLPGPELYGGSVRYSFRVPLWIPTAMPVGTS